MSAFMSALALPFLWKAAVREWGAKVAVAAGWVYALYPESVLLGGSAMREPYLWAFSAFALWGFVSSGVQELAPADHDNKWPAARLWLALGIGGMLLVSPVVALTTMIILAGWYYFTKGNVRISWLLVAAAAVIFVAGLFLLSSALNRSGEFNHLLRCMSSVMSLKLAVQWDVYQLERGSGWVQKLFDEMPEWMRLPFVTAYGIFQPVLPAAFVEPTKLIWRIISILRAAGWYTMLPVLEPLVGAAAGQRVETKRRLFLWLSFIVWMWVILTALRAAATHGIIRGIARSCSYGRRSWPGMSGSGGRN